MRSRSSIEWEASWMVVRGFLAIAVATGLGYGVFIVATGDAAGAAQSARADHTRPKICSMTGYRVSRGGPDQLQVVVRTHAEKVLLHYRGLKFRMERGSREYDGEHFYRVWVGHWPGHRH